MGGQSTHPEVRMHMGHVALRVTDPARSAEHLTGTLGLRRTFEEDGVIGLSCNEKHHEVQLLAAATAGLDHVGIEVEDVRDLARLRDALIADGVEILSESPQEPGLEHAIRVLGPGDLVLELYSGMVRPNRSASRTTCRRSDAGSGMSTSRRETASSCSAS